MSTLIILVAEMTKKPKRWTHVQTWKNANNFVVPPSAKELFYLSRMLTFVKGHISYTDIRTVENTIYPTFRATCLVLGFLVDDQNIYKLLRKPRIGVLPTA